VGEAGLTFWFMNRQWHARLMWESEPERARSQGADDNGASCDKGECDDERPGWWTCGGHMVDTWWTHGGHVVDTWWTHGGHAVDTWWTCGGHGDTRTAGWAMGPLLTTRLGRGMGCGTVEQVSTTLRVLQVAKNRKGASGLATTFNRN
jgi:hypothetical protein